MSTITQQPYPMLSDEQFGIAYRTMVNYSLFCTARLFVGRFTCPKHYL